MAGVSRSIIEVNDGLRYLQEGVSWIWERSNPGTGRKHVILQGDWGVVPDEELGIVMEENSEVDAAAPCACV